MPTILPGRVLRSTDVLDPVEINEDFQPAAEKRSGRLDQHDFNSNIRSSLSVAAGAYFRHYYDQAAASLSVGTPAAYGHPTTVNGQQIPSHGEWVLVPGLTRTVTTGFETLKVIARVQWIWMVTTALAPTVWAGVTDIGASQVQFCIAVDGRVLPWTVTGQQDPLRTPPWAIKPQSPQREYGMTTHPGSHQPRSEVCASLGRDMGSERIGTVYPVAPGSHTVEVYCRKLRRFELPASISAGTNVDQGIYIFGRQMFLQRLPLQPTSAGSFDGVEIAGLQPEDAFSAATIQTSRIDALRAAYNDIPAGALARGAFNHSHLPSPIRDYAQATIAPAAGTSSNDFYPGFGLSTLAGAKNGVTGWWLLEDGGVNNLRTDQTHAAAFSGTNASTFLVLANVQLRSIENVPQEPHVFGVFAIGYTQGGVTTVIDESEAWVNNWNYWGRNIGGGVGVDAALNEEEDVPLMAVVSLPAASTDIANFGVYGAAFDNTGTRGVLTWQRGVISVMQFRDEVTV